MRKRRTFSKFFSNNRLLQALQRTKIRPDKLSWARGPVRTGVSPRVGVACADISPWYEGATGVRGVARTEGAERRTGDPLVGSARAAGSPRTEAVRTVRVVDVGQTGGEPESVARARDTA